MSLWDWAVRAYGAEGVSETCLTLQDVHEQSVPLLLWAAWTAATGRRPDEETLEAAADAARAWDLAAVAPLRAVRRTLKAPIPDIDDPAREAVRTRVKAVERSPLNRTPRRSRRSPPLPPPPGPGAPSRRARRWSVWPNGFRPEPRSVISDDAGAEP